MGTINYYTSDYITLGVRPYDSEDFINEDGNIDYELINIYYEEDLANIKHEIEKHNFYYYHVTINPGYYEGFSLDIENNFPVALDSWEDRRSANKEITELKQFLIDCVGLGMVQCFPGWCTGYCNYTETIEAIKNATKAMREELKSIPTWIQYNRGA